MLEILLEVGRYLLPSIVVLITAYLMLSSILANTLKVKELEIAVKNRQDSIPLRLQAYERLVLFLERINPQSVISRTHVQEMSATELQMMMISNIRMEYEHNITQQLYVSAQAWMMTRAVTEEIISTINRVAASLPDDAKAIDLGKGILTHLLADQEELPTQGVIAALREEAQKMF